MTNRAHRSLITSGMGFRKPALALALFCGLAMAATQSTQAQTFSLLHSFSGGHDGGTLYSGVTIDRAGNFYGTTFSGGGTGCGGSGCGIVFKLVHRDSSWQLTPIYIFTGLSDGGYPEAGVVFGPDGSLYGTTEAGGSGGFGVVYRLQPPATACGSVLCPWIETVLYNFENGEPSFTGALTFDASGNIYGTTYDGGSTGYGSVYELSPSNGGWNEMVLHSFMGGNDGGFPDSGVILDSAGNLYGTTQAGGETYGVVYKLTHSGSGWTETVLYRFTDGSDGSSPWGGLVFDAAGKLYGTTQGSGIQGGGTVFQLSPATGAWTLTTLHTFVFDEGWPYATLTMDTPGNLYGTTAYDDGTGSDGVAFELVRSSGWTYETLHTFDGLSDGGGPYGGVTMDTSGNLYGTTAAGGSDLQNCSNGCGVVWEITP